MCAYEVTVTKLPTRRRAERAWLAVAQMLRDLREQWLPSPVGMHEQGVAQLCALRPPYGFASEGGLRGFGAFMRKPTTVL